MRPWLSVILPTYNGARYVGCALDSILQGQGAGVEVLAIDDGSTDDTLAILAKYASRLDLRIFQQGRTGNWIENTNTALKEARADHACFLHQDDHWLPGRLEAVRDFVAAHHEEAWLVHPSWFIDPAGQRLGMWRCPLSSGLIPAKQLAARLVVQNFIAIPSPVFPRRVVLDLGGMDPALRYTGDWDLWLKLALRLPARYLDRPLTAFRIHPQSQTMQLSRDREDFLGQYETVLGRHLPAIASRSAHPARLTRMAWFSAHLNVALASGHHGAGAPFFSLLGEALALGPAGMLGFARDSRIAERVAARLRIRFRPAGGSAAPFFP